MRDIFNPLHLKDVINEHILISPVGLITILMVLALCFRRIDFRDPKLIFLIIASLCFIVFTLTFYATWEQKRDWDVLSTAATPYTLLAAYLLITAIRSEKYLKYISLVLISIACLNTIPWVFSNAFGFMEYPPEYLSYQRQGADLANQGNLDQAAKSFTRALNINPEDSASALSLGYIYLARRDLPSAERIFSRVSNLYFSGAATREAHFNLGIIYALRNQCQKALKHLHRVIEMDYVYPEAQVLIRKLEMNEDDKP